MLVSSLSLDRSDESRLDSEEVSDISESRTPKWLDGGGVLSFGLGLEGSSLG